MLIKELHSTIHTFASICESNPYEHSLSFEEISDRLTKFNELNAVLLQTERNYTFSDLEEEINYYKNEKPEFQKYGIYYEIVYDLELHRSPLALKYYKKQLKKLDREFASIEPYVVYFRAKSSDRDNEYFRRESKENHIFALVESNFMLTKYLISKSDTKTADEIIASYPKVKWKLGVHDILEIARSFKGLGYADGTLYDIAMALGRFFGKEMKNIYIKSNFITNRSKPAKFIGTCYSWLIDPNSKLNE